MLNKPQIANAIIWESPDGPRSYSDWTPSQQGDLDEYFSFILFGLPYVMNDPIENQVADFLGDNDWPATVFSLDDAWALYIAHIANSLYLEWKLDSEPSINWSLTEYSQQDLALLLDSRSYLKWTDNYILHHADVSPELTGISGYEFDTRLAGNALPARPDTVLSFLRENNLITEDRLTTVGKILDWCIDLAHFSGGLITQNAEAHWQYRGLPPVVKIIEGTTRTIYPNYGEQHWTAGCHGTSGFLTAILRVINIPAKYHRAESVGHATPGIYTNGWTYLSHGDDPYNRYRKCTPQYPGEELLIDQAKWDSWFGNAIPVEERTKNVGRQVYELALIYLPNYLLHTHCGDYEAGRTHDESDVYRAFSRWYTVSELEARNLWTRIDEKIASFGDCDDIP